MKIIVSGGHLTPALSFIDYVATQKNDVVVFVGREYSQSRLQQKSVEKDEVGKRNIHFIQFDSGKLNLTDLLHLPAECFKCIFSFLEANKIFDQEKPDIFVSFGGYLAVPLALTAWMKRIPVVTHEQTITVGTANRIIGLIAKKVAISFPESSSAFPPHKVSLTGNLTREQLWQKNPPQPSWAKNLSKSQLLYITGGSQGSQSINLIVKSIVPALLENWSIIHQCGKPNLAQNYKVDLEEMKAHLPEGLRDRYQIQEWISEDELAWIYRYARAMISRAGANTVQEVIRAAIPTIFIPLTHTHHNEQVKNALSLVKNKAALMLRQGDLSSEHLLGMLSQILENHDSFVKELTSVQAALPLHAAEKLYQLIIEIRHEK